MGEILPNLSYHPFLALVVQKIAQNFLLESNFIAEILREAYDSVKRFVMCILMIMILNCKCF